MVKRRIHFTSIIPINCCCIEFKTEFVPRKQWHALTNRDLAERRQIHVITVTETEFLPRSKQ